MLLRFFELEKNNKKIKLIKGAPDVLLKYTTNYIDDNGKSKYLDKEKLIICQSNCKTEELKELYQDAIINPLGDWTGGTDVDTGATN